MKKSILWLFAAIMLVGGLTVTTSCADKEDGEKNSDYVLRNSINGTGWSISSVKQEDGTWTEDSPLCFNIKFSASNKNFKCAKFFYDENGNADESTREEYKYSDGTAYTIKNAVVEATVKEYKFFRMEIIGSVDSELHCKVFFYKDNKTVELRMVRAIV